ncbi:response regulator [Sphingomonas sp. HDW15A]|uniref:hybrid sensor histidine kinase/response regulator n=1 Tax=Sphingomonas sp. HDW15A TaxID=2714942 RepID=UPI0014079B2C|nr:response regulator [Sphingomonas sp. HDW15A]QIK96139.1 response regulator [Sphingomonas sp. HDW15A]
MLERQLALLESEAPGRLPWLVPALVAAAAASGALLFTWAGEPIYAGLFVAGMVAMLVAAFVIERRATVAPLAAPALAAPDYALVASLLGTSSHPVALSDASGRLVSANAAYRKRFGDERPDRINSDDEGRAALASLRAAAWRDGVAEDDGIDLSDDVLPMRIERVGAGGDLLLWQFGRGRRGMIEDLISRVRGDEGAMFAGSGILAAAIDPEGRVLAGNSLFADRALKGTSPESAVALDTLISGNEQQLRLIAEGEGGMPLRLVHVPLDRVQGGKAGLALLFDNAILPESDSTNVQALLDLLPLGLALVDRDGRFLTTNKAFRTAGGIADAKSLVYPGDLVVKEDKAAVADAVRRQARGPAMSRDLPVRLNAQPQEPVALTVAGLRGLGEAAVLLLLKDNSEEAKLKRQVAQATKMQAVGQLAGGVAHDFNNILTAIIGHCDLMLMRHAPGDSDYDDLQQIKSNSNRAAGLTRQLLAFSRQQTLRPQLLQLPDVVSEVSHLLKRLLGETVQLVVKHGRDLFPVRADPGQLEQVIVNLAVNARDAMQSKGGGTVTIQTYSVRADQVADLGSDILPIADYVALSIADTGTGIPANVLGKVFEPFFTTKEVGKGTGLGLSTVYGIVKQSGGFIFADSRVGEGTRFTIYLPAHEVEQGAAASRVVAKPQENELWGTGTVLLVEDEPMVRTVAERALARHGYTILTASNGEDALEILRGGEQVDLLISDVVMPVMDGPAMVREARKIHPDMPILFMSGYAEEQLRKSIDIEHVAFLPKPFSMQELAEAVRAVLIVEGAE